MTNTKLIKSRAQMQKFAGGFQNPSPRRRGTPFRKGRNAKVIALVGELGAGKTTFAQGFLKALGVKHPVTSPTFLIIRNYKLLATNYQMAYHIDCYRLNNSIELLNLGLKEILKNPAHIVLIEWPELVKKYLPKDTRWIYIKHGVKKNERTLSFRA